MSKISIKNVFVVLVYRNTDDLVEFIQSAAKEVDDYKIIVVNSYYDDESMQAFKKIASKYSCDFINVENKGYGYGNNRGIEYAVDTYRFEYLILSNPDIEIKKFTTEGLDKLDASLIGPFIKTRTNKAQNPYWAINNSVCEWLIHRGYEKKNRVYILTGTAVNRFIREFFLYTFRLSKRRYSSVFALHGSFVVFPSKLIDKIGLPYDENIFLFGEEADLAHDLRTQGIKSYITKEIEVFHKEDGSMSVAKIDEASELRKSILYYYKKYRTKE